MPSHGMMHELCPTLRSISAIASLKFILPAELNCMIKYLHYIKRTIRIFLFISVKLTIFADTVVELNWGVARIFDKKKCVTFCLATEERLCSFPLQYWYKMMFCNLLTMLLVFCVQPKLLEQDSTHTHSQILISESF